MKKLLSMFLVLVMLVGGAGSALAAEVNTVPDIPDEVIMEDTGDEGAAHKVKVKELQGYDQLLQLREEAKNLRSEIKSDHQQIKELRKGAKKEGTVDFTTLRGSLKQLHQERKSLRTAQKNNWQAMQAARQANDQAQMQSIMNDILTTRQALNQTFVQIKELQEEILASMEAGSVQAQ